MRFTEEMRARFHEQTDIGRLIRQHRRVLNKLESHLGCVECRGVLSEDGVCPRCDVTDKSDRAHGEEK